MQKSLDKPSRGILGRAVPLDLRINHLNEASLAAKQVAQAPG